MRVLIFGDSITQGMWDTDGGWVNRLRQHYDQLQTADLKNRDEPVVFNLGISADNSANILKRIVPETIARTRHGKLPVVVVQIGVNDSSADNLPAKSKSLPLKDYEENLRTIVARVKPLSSKIIFVGLSACDEQNTTHVAWGNFYYTNKNIKQYESKMQEVAAQLGLDFIPVFDSFMAELNKSRNLLPDGLHPNNQGHELMYQIIAPKLKPLLKA